MLTIAEKSGKAYDHLSFDMTQPIDLKTVEETLKADRHCRGYVCPLRNHNRPHQSPERTDNACQVTAKGVCRCDVELAAYDIDMPGLDMDAGGKRQ